MERTVKVSSEGYCPSGLAYAKDNGDEETSGSDG